MSSTSTNPVTKDTVTKMYIDNNLSMAEIAAGLGCSVNKVVYWMNKYEIPRRTISDAIYKRSNPNGDPFQIVSIKTAEQAHLMGMGLGLYWGEGNKSNIHSVRLGNTDPELIKVFIAFLKELFCIDADKLRFSLQIFSDTEPDVAVKFWKEALEMPEMKLGKVIVTKSGSIGTYRHKNSYGVMTVHFHNKKLRDIIVGLLPR